MASLPYISINISDYLADTWHLTTEEHGAYLLLIMNYWQTEKPIPANRVQGVIRLDNDRYTSVMGNLKEFFNEDENGDWHHGRIEADLSVIRDKSKKASAAGKASAQKRWGSESVDSKGSNGSPIADPQQESNERVTNKNKSKNKSNSFVKPTTDEIHEYMKQRDNHDYSEVERYFDYNESKGWKVGNTGMKDWKASVRTWLSNAKKFSNNNQTVARIPGR